MTERGAQQLGGKQEFHNEKLQKTTLLDSLRNKYITALLFLMSTGRLAAENLNTKDSLMGVLCSDDIALIDSDDKDIKKELAELHVIMDNGFNVALDSLAPVQRIELDLRFEQLAKALKEYQNFLPKYRAQSREEQKQSGNQMRDQYEQKHQEILDGFLHWLHFYNKELYNQIGIKHSYKGGKWTDKESLRRDHVLLDGMAHIMKLYAEDIEKKIELNFKKHYPLMMHPQDAYQKDVERVQRLGQELQDNVEGFLAMYKFTPETFIKHCTTYEWYQKEYNKLVEQANKLVDEHQKEAQIPNGQLGIDEKYAQKSQVILEKLHALQTQVGIGWITWMEKTLPEYTAFVNDPVMIQKSKVHSQSIQQIVAVGKTLQGDTELQRRMNHYTTVKEYYIYALENISGYENTFFLGMKDKYWEEKTWDAWYKGMKENDPSTYYTLIVGNSIVNTLSSATLGQVHNLQAIIDASWYGETNRELVQDKYNAHTALTTFRLPAAARESLIIQNKDGSYTTNFTVDNTVSNVASGVTSLFLLSKLASWNKSAGMAPTAAISLATAELYGTGNITTKYIENQLPINDAIIMGTQATATSMLTNAIFPHNEMAMLKGGNAFRLWFSNNGKQIVHEILEENTDMVLQSINHGVYNVLNQMDILDTDLSPAHFAATTYITALTVGTLRAGTEGNLMHGWLDQRNANPQLRTFYDETLGIMISMVEKSIVNQEASLLTQGSKNGPEIDALKDKLKLLKALQEAVMRNPVAYEQVEGDLLSIIEELDMQSENDMIAGRTYREWQANLATLNDDERIAIAGKLVATLAKSSYSDDTKALIRDAILQGHHTEQGDGTKRIRAKLDILLQLLKNKELQEAGLTQQDLVILLRAGVCGKFKVREYQIEAWAAMEDFYQRWLANHASMTTVTEDSPIPSSMLVHMATGSGKTYTTFSFIKKLFEARKENNDNIPFENFKILVLSHQKGITDQLRKDALEGKAGKPPILGDFAAHIHAATFHSDSDDTHQSGKEFHDEMYFATFQTSGIDGRLPSHFMPNIIIVDEAHHLNADAYLATLQDYYKSIGQAGRMPLVIFMTATPNEGVLDITGEITVNYGLAEYLVDEYSPTLNYHLSTLQGIDPSAVTEIMTEIQEAMQLTNHSEKKQENIRIMGKLNDLLRRAPTIDAFVDDVLGKIQQNPGPSIVFAKDINESKEMALAFENKRGNNGKTILLHSKMTKEQKKDAVEGYANGKYDIIVSVNMLNEGIDLPETSNVFLWRITGSAIIFGQQLGRGLRGDEVFVYDYAGGIVNMTTMWNLQTEMDAIYDQREGTRRTGEETKDGEIKERKRIITSYGDEAGSEMISLDISKMFGKLETLDKETTEEIGITVKLIRKELGKYGTELELLNMSQPERGKVKICGLGLISLSNRLGVEGNPVAYNHVRYNFLEKLLQKKPEEILIKGISDELGKYGSNFELINLGTKEKRSIKLSGQGLIKLSNRIGIEGDPIVTNKIRYEFLEKIFDRKIEEISIEWIRKKLLQTWSEDELVNMGVKERKNMKIGGQGLVSLSRKIGIEGNVLDQTEVWNEFLEKILNKKVTYISKNTELETNFYLDLIRQELLTYGTEFQLINMGVEERKNMKIGRQGVISLSRKIGIEGNVLDQTKVWNEFLEKIFDRKIEEILIKEIHEKLLQTWSEDELVKMSVEERKKIKIGGLGLIALASKLGIEGNPIRHSKGWHELLEKVLEKKVSDIDPNLAIQQVLSIEIIREELLKLGTELELLHLFQTERQKIKIGGLGLTALASKLGIEGNPINHSKGWHELLEKVFGKTIEEMSRSD